MAEGFSNKDFLAMTDQQKSHWIYAMVDTLGFVAAYKDKAIGHCVWAWYSNDAATANGLIIFYMKQYPEKSPSMIAIGLAEKECGKFVRSQN